MALTRILWRRQTSDVRVPVVASGPQQTRQKLTQRLWPESGASSPIPALDGMRTLAVALVLLFHSWTGATGINRPGAILIQDPLWYGRTGVHLFFVLSGFLLFMPYARWIYGLQSRPSTRLFYRRRLLRVGPAYWANLALLVLAGGVFTAPMLLDVLAHVFFLSNLSQNWLYTINGVFWTMAIEVQFYVVLPLLALALFALTRRLRPLPAIALFTLALTLVTLISGKLAQTRLGAIPSVWTLFVGEPSLTGWISIFGAGIVCSMWYVWLTASPATAPDRATRLWRLNTPATGAFLGGVVLALALAFFHPDKVVSVTQVLWGWAYAGILVGVLLGAPTLRTVFASRPMRFVGLISYSYYLWHSIILRAIEPPLVGLPPFAHVLVRFILGGILSVVVAYVSYQLVERPFIQARRNAHDSTPVLAVTKAALVAP